MSLGEGLVAEAETLPFDDESFDLVLGHAVLHHIPDLDRAFAEFRRVLRPGGLIAFAGEPSRYGDRLAALPKRAGILAAPVWRRLVGAHERTVAETDLSHGHSLEGEVDVHAFAPADLRRLLRDSGFASWVWKQGDVGCFLVSDMVSSDDVERFKEYFVRIRVATEPVPAY